MVNKIVILLVLLSLCSPPTKHRCCLCIIALCANQKPDYVAILCDHFEDLAAQKFYLRRVGNSPQVGWIRGANQIAGCLPHATDRNLPAINQSCRGFQRSVQNLGLASTSIFLCARIYTNRIACLKANLIMRKLIGDAV